MFGNGLSLAEFKNILLERYGYSEDLAEDIVIVAKDLEEHFGTEYTEVILRAVAETKVECVKKQQKGKSIVRENIKDVLTREGLADTLSSDEFVPFGTDLRSLEGLFVQKPLISCTDNGFCIAKDQDGNDIVQKLIVINSEHIPSNTNFLATLAGELTKAVTSQLQTYTIEGDTLTVKHGLNIRTEKLLRVDNDVKRIPIRNLGYGLQQGLTNYNKLGIVRESHADTYDLQEYSLSVLAAGTILAFLKLDSVIAAAQVTKDLSELRSIIQNFYPGNYEEFLSILDKLYDLEKKSAELSTGDKIDAMQAMDELENYYKNIVSVTLGEIRKRMKIGLSQEELSHTEGNTL